MPINDNNVEPEVQECDYGPCERTSLPIMVEDHGTNSRYCSKIHCLLDRLEDYALNVAADGRVTIKRAYKTAQSVLKKLAVAAEKEWQATAKK